MGPASATTAPARARRRQPGVLRPLKLPRIAGLDGLRVSGALAVVIYHVLGALRGADAVAGVLLPPAAFTFFMISGYVIYRPFVAAHATRSPAPSARRFWWSRAIRVLPLWWIAIAAYLAVDGAGSLDGTRDWILTIGLLQFVSRSARYAVIGPAWALSVEWIFYLAAPLVAMAVRASHRRWARHQDILSLHLWVIATVALACSIFSPLRAFLAIAIGMALAVIDVRRHQTRSTPRWLRACSTGGVSLVVTAVAGAVLVGYPYKAGLSVQWIEQDPTVVILWIGVATAWFLPVVFGPGTGPITSRLSSPLAIRLGTLTFGLYLWHDLVLRQVTDRLGLDANLFAVLYLTALGAVILASITYLIVERPTMKLRAAWAGRGAGRPDALTGRVEAPSVTDSRSTAPPAAHSVTSDPTGRSTAATKLSPSDPTSPTRRAAPAASRSTAWIGSIDGLRVIAALCVVGFHVTAEQRVSARTAQSLAALAIPVFATFFLVSGYVLYRPWAVAQARMAYGDGQAPARAPDGGARQFWLRRALRVYPVYWVVQGVAMLVSGTTRVHGVVEWIQLITLFPLPDFGVIINHGLGVIVWTMVVELTYYALLPGLARVVTALVGRGTSFVTAQVLVLGTLGVGLSISASTNARVLGVAVCIVLGMAIAALDAWQRANRRWMPGIRTLAGQPALAIPVVALSWAAGTAVSRGDDPDLLFRTHLGVHLAAMVAVSFVLFIPAVLGPRRSRYRRVLGSAPMRALGPLTFGVYLWHYPAIRQTVKVVDLPLAVLFVWALVAAAALASGTYFLVERPMERLRHKRLGRTAPVVATAPTASARTARTGL